MAQKKIQVKVGDNVRWYGAKAAKIAIDHLGGIEIKPFEQPIELKTRVLPPEITKPIPLVIKTISPNVEVKPEIKTEVKSDVIHDFDQSKTTIDKPKGRRKSVKK